MKVEEISWLTSKFAISFPALPSNESKLPTVVNVPLNTSALSVPVNVSTPVVKLPVPLI